MRLKNFFYGILTALGALAIESVVMIFATTPDLAIAPEPATWFMPVAVLIEEFISLILLTKLFQNDPDKKTAFTRALLFGAGFSVPEILLNYSNFSVLSQDVIFAYLGLFLLHTATAGLFGLYFSRQTNFTPSLSLFLLLAIAVHLAFNFSILSNLNIWLSLALPVSVILISFLSSKTPLLKTSLPIQKN